VCFDTGQSFDTGKKKIGMTEAGMALKRGVAAQMYDVWR
jgi:hypothetical protein